MLKITVNVLKGVSLTLLGSRHIECRDSLLESIWPQLSSVFSLLVLDCAESSFHEVVAFSYFSSSCAFIRFSKYSRISESYVLHISRSILRPLDIQSGRLNSTYFKIWKLFSSTSTIFHIYTIMNQSVANPQIIYNLVH